MNKDLKQIYITAKQGYDAELLINNAKQNASSNADTAHRGALARLSVLNQSMFGMEQRIRNGQMQAEEAREIKAEIKQLTDGMEGLFDEAAISNADLSRHNNENIRLALRTLEISSEELRADYLLKLTQQAITPEVLHSIIKMFGDNPRNIIMLQNGRSLATDNMYALVGETVMKMIFKVDKDTRVELAGIAECREFVSNIFKAA